MAKQSLIWTTLPNGCTQDGRHLRISILLSPRLDPQSDPQELDSFPDFWDWPHTLAAATFTVRWQSGSVAMTGLSASGPVTIDSKFGTPDSGVWGTVFSRSTFVRGFEFQNMEDKTVLSYSTTSIADLLRSLYTDLAAKSPDSLPTAAALVADPGWKAVLDAVAANDLRFYNRKTHMHDPAIQFNWLKDQKGAKRRTLADQLALAQLFHTPPTKPRIRTYDNVPAGDPREKARWLEYERKDLPAKTDFAKEIDFHQIVAAMNQYPTLLRLLGIVVDLSIDADKLPLSPDLPLWIEVDLPPRSPNAERTPSVSPRTHTVHSSGRFEALSSPVPRPAGLRVENCLLKLNPDHFALLQADVDGAALKLMNFARSLRRLERLEEDGLKDPTTKKDREAGAPALRNAGLMLVQRDRASALTGAFARSKQFDESAQAILNPNQPPPNPQNTQPPELYAEDLVRGYRIDIWNNRTKLWNSLCERTAEYDLGPGKKQISATQDEATVRLAATRSSDPATNADVIYLHEALTCWAGWSLGAPPPGMTIRTQEVTDPANPAGPKLKRDQPADPEAEAAPGLPLKTTFTAKAGSLPRLRFGRKYWIRARVVDLAGNSLPVSSKDFGPEHPDVNATPYLRYDPVAPPAIALVQQSDGTLLKPGEGESMERIAIRSFNDTPADNQIASMQVSSRYAVPSRTTVREAEHHGVLDNNGKVDPATFGMLCSLDENLPAVDVSPIPPATGQPAKYAVLKEGGETPYLPDPLCLKIAARLFNHPDVNGNDLTAVIPIPAYPSPVSAWPNALPFRIRIYEKAGDKPRWSEGDRTLYVPLPKATRATLRLSVMPGKEALGNLGIWQWLPPATRQQLEPLALAGQHWMLTPWKDIELVHAVQRPLFEPQFEDLLITRKPTWTRAWPEFRAKLSIESTDRVDLMAEWHEPKVTTADAVGEDRLRTDLATSIKITEGRDYEGRADYVLMGPDLIRVGRSQKERVPQKIHEFNDTRYRRIEYWLEATTRFREYMPYALLFEPSTPQDLPTDKNIKVTGSRVVRWIPNTAPPPAPKVLYVVPTYGWVRSSAGKTQGSWRRGGGLRIYLEGPWNHTGYGEMLAVVLPSAALQSDPNSTPQGRPLKNYVTQWGNDPIWLSPFVAGFAPTRGTFALARTARDPSGAWLPPNAPPSEADQPAEAFQVTNLSVPGTDPGTPEALVEIAPHDVFWDDDRKLWYCDLEIDAGSAYYPFIRLALACYQPVSTTGAHLSGVVLADFMPLVNDRWLTLTRETDPKVRRVAVYGHTYSDTRYHQEMKSGKAGESGKLPRLAARSVLEAWVERLDPALGEDFGWRRDTEAKVVAEVRPAPAGPEIVKTAASKALLARAKTLLAKREFKTLVDESLIEPLLAPPKLWQGIVKLPEVPAPDRRYRLVVAEYEEYLDDGASPYDPEVWTKGRRMVYAEHVTLT